ncbi:MAG: segregation/condensation protein A [Anaerolineaceae bacterium]|nr:segregation/condensation protein A [Anaerolineaceae bacterium]
MSLKIAEHQSDDYLVNTNVYEGPLDLLLELIEHAELDITRLSLAQVTDQYLAYMHKLEERDPAKVSAFLVIAARLIQIKAAALLPKPTLVDMSGDEEDPAEALERQLILYRRYKQIAEHLSTYQQNNYRTYLRVAPPPIQIDVKFDLSNVGLEDLIEAAKRVFLNKPDLKSLNTVVNIPRITIRDRISTIMERFKYQNKFTFRSLLDSKNRVETVVSFLAVLELVKRHILQAQQLSIFGDIDLEKSGSLETAESIEIEFDE